MSARDKIIDWFEHSEDIPRLADSPRGLAVALLDEYAHELAENIRAEAPSAGSNDRYGQALQDAALIDPRMKGSDRPVPKKRRRRVPRESEIGTWPGYLA